jgi:hypothetical protein
MSTGTSFGKCKIAECSSKTLDGEPRDGREASKKRCVHQDLKSSYPEPLIYGKNVQGLGSFHELGTYCANTFGLQFQMLKKSSANRAPVRSRPCECYSRVIAISEYAGIGKSRRKKSWSQKRCFVRVAIHSVDSSDTGQIVSACGHHPPTNVMDMDSSFVSNLTTLSCLPGQSSNRLFISSSISCGSSTVASLLTSFGDVFGSLFRILDSLSRRLCDLIYQGSVPC